MNQNWIVGLIVLLAGLYAVWHWLPARLRRRLLRQPETTPASGSACGGCSGCGDGSCAPAASDDWRVVQSPAAAPPQEGASGGRP